MKINKTAQLYSDRSWVLRDFVLFSIIFKVLQKRHDGTISFDRDWDAYKYGFGHVGGEFWLGNQNIYVITNQREYEVQLEVEEFDGTLHLTKYNHFRITDESTHYRLATGTYTGMNGNCNNINFILVFMGQKFGLEIQ